MSLCAWSDQWKVGDAMVDSQHQKLVEMINRLYDAMMAGKANDTLGNRLRELVAYTRNHFGAEERLMSRHQYPEFARHKKIHDDFTATILQAQAKFDAGTAGLTIPLMKTLKDWLVNHICAEDQRFGAYKQDSVRK